MGQISPPLMLHTAMDVVWFSTFVRPQQLDRFTRNCFTDSKKSNNNNNNNNNNKPTTKQQNKQQQNEK